MESEDFHPGEYLTFRLSGQEFAIDATRVRGIVPLFAVEPVEPSIPGLLGQSSVRGRTCPVRDLAKWLKLMRPVQGRDPYVLAVETARGLIGFPVDRVCDVVLARARDFSHGRIRIGRPRRVLDPDGLFVEAA